jgi:hypothetical protein
VHLIHMEGCIQHVGGLEHLIAHLIEVGPAYGAALTSSKDVGADSNVVVVVCYVDFVAAAVLFVNVCASSDGSHHEPIL